MLTSTIAPLASDSQQSPGELGVAALLTRKPVALQLLTLGLIKSISPSILIQVLSTAIRRVTERQGNSNRLVLTLTVRCVVHRESPPSCRVPLPSPGRERRLCMPGYSSPHACQAEARLMHLCSFCKFFLGYFCSVPSPMGREILGRT